MVQDFMTFKKMITPFIIQVLFVIGVVGSIAIGLISIGSWASSRYSGGGSFLLGVLWIFLGPIVVRIYCELIVVIFSINNTLADIRSSLKSESEP